MTKTATEREYNLKNLKDVSPYLKDMEYFLFFGTLLGLCRENNIIEGDDDVDLLVNTQHRNEILEIIRNLGFNININNPHIVQGTRYINNKLTHIDFYFYENPVEQPYIVEKWNFFSRPHDINYHLHIPKSIIYPLTTGQIGGIECKVPLNIKECCKFLYGERYMTPMEMKTEYMVERLVNNIPEVKYY
jgi:hypothetical protein